MRYAAAAIPARLGSSSASVQNSPKTEKGGRLGDVADFLLSKTGKPGALASKFALGSRIVDRFRGNDAGSPKASVSDGEQNQSDEHVPLPVQESIEVAVPIGVAYDLCTRFEEYPEFIERLDGVERTDDKTFVFEAKVRGTKRRVQIELIDERPNRRIDWEGVEGLEHSGVISFHELAPSLTHIELSVDLERQGLVQRLMRAAHLTEHAIRTDMRRFKAYAELYEDVDEAEGEGGIDDESAQRGQDETRGEQESEDGVVDEEEPAAQQEDEELPEGEYEDEEEIEPARAH